MENLLQGIPGVCIYIDDILITGHTEDWERQTTQGIRICVLLPGLVADGIGVSTYISAHL